MVTNGKRKTDYSSWSKPELLKEITKLTKRRKYGLIWDEERTKEIFEQEVQKKLPVLKDVTRNGIVDKSKPNNILIEGDNYHALSVLNYTHKRKIDVIYIDPPYNTGKSKEWKYNDRYIDEKDGYMHSKWLSFMSKRLKLAHNLLSSKGVIFISIDDHEQAHLKLLCDEIFHPSNFIVEFAWRKTDNQANIGKIANIKEYILCYAKNKSLLSFNKIRLTSRALKEYRYGDEDNKFRRDILLHKTRGSHKYSVTTPSGKTLTGPWMIAEKEFKNLESNNGIYWAGGKQEQPYGKIYLKNSEGMIPNDFLTTEIGTNQQGSNELTGIFGHRVFDFPKPVSLIKHFCTIASNKNSIILDFFAGSGTTGHAVLDLNKEDDGNRKFILCTNNENNICTDVCYPRLKKVIKGYKNPKGQKVEGLGGNLKYFRTFFVDSEPTDRNKKIMVEQSTEMLCLKENCFDLVKGGKQFKIFKNHDGHYLGIIYYYEGIESFKKEALKLDKKINTYVFSLSDTVDESDFELVDHLVNLKPIPSAILNVYKRIFAYVQTKTLSRKTRK